MIMSFRCGIFSSMNGIFMSMNDIPLSMTGISIHTYICLFSEKVYRFYGEGLQSFEKCLDLEKNCFADPLNFVLRPSRFKNCKGVVTTRKFNGVLTEWTK